MRYDAIVIGGGLSGLTTAIKLQNAGKKTLLVSKAQSRLSLNGACFEMLGRKADGEVADNPAEYLEQLPETHPYRKVGKAKWQQLAGESKKFLISLGLKVSGNLQHNHYCVGPMGNLMPTWLTIDGFLRLQRNENLKGLVVGIIDIKHFLDFPIEFLAQSLSQLGAKVQVNQIALDAPKVNPNEPHEIRATTIARANAGDNVIADIAEKIASVSGDCDWLLVPDVFGIDNDAPFDFLQQQLQPIVRRVPTLPPSVSGMRLDTIMRNQFQTIGGTIMPLTEAISAQFASDGSVQSITFKNATMQAVAEASHFVLATGSFATEGLRSNQHRVFEPVFGCDVDFNHDHGQWTVPQSLEPQPYMEFGVITDNDFHPLRYGKPVPNLYAIGSILNRTGSLRYAANQGIDLITAHAVAEIILAKK